MKAINGESRQAEKLVHISRITPIGQIIKKIFLHTTPLHPPAITTH